MSQTTIEKILSRAGGGQPVRPGDVVVYDVDRVIMIEIQFRMGWVQPLKIYDANKVSLIFDHASPAGSVQDANTGNVARGFARDFGVKDVYDVGDHGIAHQVIAENGLALPGQLLACADSHSTAGGAFNCAARGLGPAEMIQILCTGKTWGIVPETVRYNLEGSLPASVYAKDIFLYIAGKYGSVAQNKAIEFSGPGIEALSMGERRVLSTQGVELVAEYTLFPCDEMVRSTLAALGIEDYTAAWSDDDADFAFEDSIDMSDMEPQIAAADYVLENTSPVAQFESVKLDQCFVGSCANGKLEDLEIAANIVRGKRVARGTRFIVTPASQRVALEAARRGYTADLLEAGAVVTPPMCGACYGYDMGVVGDGETCLTSSTRNYKGRMGSAEASVLMASSATVAASAIVGRVVDPREVAS
ncbi:MAG: aconitase/3-isopropylmalate dehydratase large subunit family protein [Halieaceae bacterium]|nr:aconitase/3-isopropylmalate dehydratase large subunit family protein [Halieaceae bacterium]